MMYFVKKASLIFTIAATAGAQSRDNLTAREIFYAAAGKPADSKPAKPAQRTARPPVHKADTTSTTAASSSPAPAPAITPLKLASFSHKPLGVRLSVLRVAQSGQMVEVAPDTSFRPDDRVRLNIQVSDNGYLYIINRGSSGTWTQLFPSPDIPNASNAVAPGVTYSIPPDRNFVVSNPPGAEKMFIILSRQPQLDIDALTVEMSRRESGAAPNPPPAPKSQQTLMAANLPPMNDAAVDRLRNFYSRDLIIEKVDEQSTSKENAVYAVSTADGDNDRVVLDAQIKHN